MTRQVSRSRGTRRNKIMAILAGGAVLGLGTTATLASWTDTEWVFGGNAAGNGPGVGTSSFEVEQNVISPFETDFEQKETNPGQALVFGVSALSLSPGDKIYAPVALRTVEVSLGGELTMAAAVPAAGINVIDADGLLWKALKLRVLANDIANPGCNADAFTATTGSIVATGDLTAAGTSAQTLEANGGSTTVYCFELSLPAGASSDLQGRSAAPAWKFDAVSTTPTE
jgi:predicted ribosomally synthesized peptide with SipW-like signal peptide